MDDAIRDRIAAVVELHEVYAITEQDDMCRMLRSSRWRCECGDEGPIPTTGCEEDAVRKANAKHLANEIIADATAALVESGIAAAALNGNRPPDESVYAAQRALDEFNRHRNT